MILSIWHEIDSINSVHIILLGDLCGRALNDTRSIFIWYMCFFFFNSTNYSNGKTATQIMWIYVEKWLHLSAWFSPTLFISYYISLVIAINYGSIEGNYTRNTRINMPFFIPYIPLWCVGFSCLAVCGFIQFICFQCNFPFFYFYPSLL